MLMADSVTRVEDDAGFVAGDFPHFPQFTERIAEAQISTVKLSFVNLPVAISHFSCSATFKATNKSLYRLIVLPTLAALYCPLVQGIMRIDWRYH
jgi:hypothetical protein